MRFQKYQSNFFRGALCLMIPLGLFQIEAFAAKNEAEQNKQTSLWQTIAETDLAIRGRRLIVPEKYRVYRLDAQIFNDLLADAAMECTPAAQDREPKA